jgi:parvulin-like peptidyl-prolyl isomerase
MTSKEARALGLKVFPSFARCAKDGTNLRTTARGLCVACQESKKAERRARDKAIADKVRAEVLKTARAAVLREMEAEERQRQRDADKARKETERAAIRAQREAEKEAQEKERRRQKAARTRAKNKAKREATSAATAAQVVAPLVDAAPPWDEATSAPSVPANSIAAPATTPAPVAEVSRVTAAEAPPHWAEFADCLAFDNDPSPWD